MRHTAQLSLAAQLLRRLNKFALDDCETLSSRELLSLLAIVQLVSADLLPNSLVGTDSAASLGWLLTGGSCRIDETGFAKSTTRIAACGAPNFKQKDVFFAIARDVMFAPLFQDPCLLGWIYQLLIKQSAPSIRTGEEISGANIGRATQWFTPSWIARFLVKQTIGAGTIRKTLAQNAPAPPLESFLDPACGAGHILVYALEQHASLAREQVQAPKEISLKISQRQTPESLSEEALHHALASQIFGLDIDQLMIELCGFALYLQARRLSANLRDFPVPKLYVWRTRSGDDDPVGSLRLTNNDDRSDGYLYSPLTGESGPASSLLPDTFDAIATNPPYLSHRMMPESISGYLKSNYQTAHYDLYSAFLSMAVQLLKDNGRLAMICQQSFLSIQRYQNLRNELYRDCRFEAIAQLGPGSFAAKAGEKVNNAIIVLHKSRQKTHDVLDQSDAIRCWRLLSNAEKESAEASGLEGLPFHSVSSSEAQALFNTIGNAPLAFWCPAEITELFRIYPALESSETGITCSNGLFTCDNKRFVKTHDQVAEADRHEYVPYDKGGGQKWYRTTPYLLRWLDGGEEIRQFRKSRGQSAALPGEQYYFRTGVTYSYIGTRGFKARLLSPSSIFDIASSAVFSEEFENDYLVGFFNSSLVCFLLGVLNPTINFQIGDLRRLPFVTPDPQTQHQIANLSRRAIEIARQVEHFDPTSPLYLTPMFEGSLESAWAGLYQVYLRKVEGLNQEEAAIQDQIDRQIFALYGISETTQAIIACDPWVVRSRAPICKPRTYDKHVGDLRSFLRN